MPNGDFICTEHSGFKARIETMEKNVTELWSKWNGLQKTIIGIFVTLCMNLLGIIFLLLRG